MKLSDFDYQLPEALIAQVPLAKRNASRLLVVDPTQQTWLDSEFQQLSSYLNEGDLLVFNNTRVLPARLYGQKQSGGRVEVLVERVLDANCLLAHIRSSKSPKPGSQLTLEQHIDCTMLERRGALFLLQQNSQQSWFELLEEFGHIPLPPYIQRADNRNDQERYQTVYAEVPGAVAAPTAGLHFEQTQLQALARQGVQSAYLTLHVGAGTFQPVREDDIEAHVMHAETIQVPQSVCDAIQQTQDAGKRVIAVGTTVVRSLEAAALNGKLEPYQGDTKIFIKPGFEFNVVDAMITNFHLPKSTLLMLVSAFAGSRLIRQVYEHAVRQAYRFFSYGDAMLISSRASRE